MQKSGISYKSYRTAVRSYDLKENAEAFLVTHKIKKVLTYILFQVVRDL